MALSDRDDLARMDEQAFDLGRLVRAPHPALEPSGRRPWGEIAGREAQKRIVAGEPRHDNLADLALGGGIVRAGRDDLDDEVVVDQHAGHEPAVGVVGLPGDHAEVGGGVGLPRVDSGAFELGAQRRRERRGGDQRLHERRDVGA